MTNTPFWSCLLHRSLRYDHLPSTTFLISPTIILLIMAPKQSTTNLSSMQEDNRLPIITYGGDGTLSRPEAARRVTAPETPILVSSLPKTFTHTLPFRPRNRSPRSYSSASSLSCPPMTRAHSLPSPETATIITLATSVRPSSPLGPSSRRRSPLRRSSDEPCRSFEGQVDIGETISENSELDLKPRINSDGDTVPFPSSSSTYHTFPRVRRRPSSPLYQTSQPTSRAVTPNSVLRTSTSSPSLSAAQFNEPFPSNYSFSSSSMPSTPTSLRSRSPSISSLETIPDSPDAELEAETLAQLKAAADNENDSEGEDPVGKRRGLDMGRVGAMRDKRKRWSVCGAERRGDLDLETIWED